MDNKVAAKELAAKMRAKADILESLTEEQLTELKANIDKENPANGGCVFTTPCILVECFHSSQA